MSEDTRFKMWTVGEILEEARKDNTEPWEPAKAKRRVEESYRRGYHDGWVQAINQMWELMFDHHMKREDAYRLMWEFWETGKLSQWQRNLDEDGNIKEHWNSGDWPPEVGRMDIQEFRER